ncbi:hypothetical protein [Caballeronia sp. KNU42]
MPCTNADLRRYIEEFFEEESYLVDDVDENEYRKDKALEAFDALVSRESALLARIQQLEERAAQAAELVAKAVDVMVPKEGKC